MAEISQTKLTREQKLALIDAIEEKKRREASGKPTYKPNAGQLPVHLSKSMNRFVFSGNGMGKTVLLVNELKWILEGYNPITQEVVPANLVCIVVVDSARKIEENILPALRKWMDVPDKWLRRNTTKYISHLSNDRAEIRFYSVESDPMLFEGITIHRVFADEPLPRHLYQALKRGLRDKAQPGRFLFCGTPIGQPWLRTEIYEPWTKAMLPDTECFRTSSYVNSENLDMEGIKSFERTLSPAELATRIEGAFFDADTMALAHLWKRDTHITDITWDADWPVVIGIDPHYAKPHVAVMVGADPDNNLMVLKELCVKLTAREFAFELMDWMKGKKVVDIVCDSLGATDGTGNEGFASFITIVNQVLRSRGKPGVRSTTFEDKSHEAAIDRLQSGLLIPDSGPPKLRVDHTCKGVIDNIESVGWQKNRYTGETKPKLDTSTKDFLSALCYALASNVRFNKGQEKPLYLKKAPYAGLSLKHLRQKHARR